MRIEDIPLITAEEAMWLFLEVVCEPGSYLRLSETEAKIVRRWKPASDPRSYV